MLSLVRLVVVFSKASSGLHSPALTCSSLISHAKGAAQQVLDAGQAQSSSDAWPVIPYGKDCSAV
ncbi:hypothetical protein E2C01_094048 [Portunus trituberculatus]|uniref:Uncharacterized protein n=1 Tax=Portunus trituberculatus TaxID=210409 RepID=A0A5B7JV54_PORTR|nr:hypothetical protein [Portunus trituberculatus]